MEAVTRMSRNYDMVVTSGGIGPTCVSTVYSTRCVCMYMCANEIVTQTRRHHVPVHRARVRTAAETARRSVRADEAAVEAAQVAAGL